MKELNFSISINLSLTLKEDKARINIKNVDLIPAVVSLPHHLISRDRKASSKTEKKTVHDIILQTAKKYVIDTGQNEFTGAKLFNLSLLDHPRLKRNTFAAQVIAAAPNHPSHRHYPNRKDYFTYLGKGNYKLNPMYLEITEGQILLRIPVVCSALRSRKFLKNCDIELAYIGEPNNSTTTTFTYRLKIHKEVKR